MLDRLAELVNEDPSIVRLGRFMSCEFVIAVGDASYHVEVRQGRIEAVRSGPLKMRSHAFAISAPDDVWDQFWGPLPDPGYQDIFAMTRWGHAKIDGDLAPLLANLRYVKEVLAAPRRLNRRTGQ
ncbi:MAG: hypothetical protein HOL85_08195 [Rhodospirillaceae bacterium]|nr:hypothetical protein [Rhodospirillaceae bacterium]MBT6135985.1 hypothetical protein [Rhodospirillaceae bacterium]MBT7613534.1 hypothetical protein [Rhodospirillaceae bacterium]